MKAITTLILAALAVPAAMADRALTRPIAGPDLVFEEKDGFVAVEAEHFVSQSKDDIRAWYLTTADRQAALQPDADPAHVAGAGRGAYLEILPDTRKDHGEKLIPGENFSTEPGRMAVLRYRVHFNTPGKYHVWARTHSTGTEDNGLHVGIDGTWPASGQRMQWTAKRKWAWGSRQRTQDVHAGVPGILFLEVAEPGEHTIEFSMREDGFEFDAWIMTTDATFEAPEGAAPESVVKAGSLPPAFEMVATEPATATAAAGATVTSTQPALWPADFPVRRQSYLDRGKWVAVDPDAHQASSSVGPWPFRDGRFDLTLHAVGENDGRSTYELVVEGEPVGRFECPLADETCAEGPKFTKTFRDVLLSEGAMVEVKASIGSEDGEEFSRARWSRIAVAPADGKPLAARADAPKPAPVSAAPAAQAFTGDLFGERGEDGRGDVAMSGEFRQWHKVTLTFEGPFAHERDNRPNPFTDYRFDVTFAHGDSGASTTVPGYFAADGKAGETSAESGNRWRVHFAPDRPGMWHYQVSFRRGAGAALDSAAAAEPVPGMHGHQGTFSIDESDKTGRDLRGKGRLRYVGRHHLRFEGSGGFFVKAGADAPETFLACTDFDGTVANKPGKAPLKTWSAHVRDWREGDPTWKDGKGKGIIGAINYLSGKGCNVFSFLTYNAGGDGDNVWPFIARDDKMHYDCSKLDQWGAVFDHGTARGMFLHFKLQETENDDSTLGGHKDSSKGNVPAALDGGDLGPERKLYLRELVARFGHNLALNWNLGEENTQTTAQQRAMASYLREVDPYDHLIVVHTFPNQQDKVYRPLLGEGSVLRGASLQNSDVKDCHHQVVKWTRESASAGVPWVVSFDEPGTAGEGMPPDPGYPGTPDNFDNPSVDQVRKQVLWGTLLAGGGGVEYYFGYKLPQNDLVCEDWRSRDKSWEYCRIALDFFMGGDIPFAEMTNRDELVGNPEHDNSAYCYAQRGEIYLVYLPDGGSREIDLAESDGTFTLGWFNPREGGAVAVADGERVDGGGRRKLTAPGDDDWLAVLRR